MKQQDSFSEPTKSEFRGKRNIKSKDRHREPSDLWVDGNIKHLHKNDYINENDEDFDDLVDIDPTFNWSKIK
jgi:hypothetical protein